MITFMLWRRHSETKVWQGEEHEKYPQNRLILKNSLNPSRLRSINALYPLAAVPCSP